MRVAFLPTGRTEWHGLRGAFDALFPAHDFYVLPTADEVQSHPEEFPCAGFTSNPLEAAHEASPPEAASELIGRAAQAALGSRTVKPADLVVVLDDLELVNVNQPDRVARVFRAATVNHIEALGGGQIETRTRAALRDRVSFHLLVPMVEALFFADPAALLLAGVPVGLSVTFADHCDPEAFQTTDAAYLVATEAACPCWSGLPAGRRKKKQRPKWLGRSPRDRHPKGYLQWLCRDGNAPSCTTYSETTGGGRALAGIAWPTVLSRPEHHFQYLRALLADVEDRLGQHPTTGPVLGSQAVATSRFTPRPDPVLRNL